MIHLHPRIIPPYSGSFFIFAALLLCCHKCLKQISRHHYTKINNSILYCFTAPEIVRKQNEIVRQKMAGQFHVIPIFLILFAFLFALRAASFVKMVAGNDYAGNKFQDCCKKAEISCCEVCKYPPPDFTFWEQYCMLSYNAAFIACYTGGHNNTKCCSDRGVVGVYGICQDFCDGTTSHSWDMRYMVCGSVKKIISECNHDSIKPQPITEENRTWK